jgi:hypothetical protein
MHAISDSIKIDRILGYFAAGQVARTSEIVDMSGYEGALFIFDFGTLIQNGTLTPVIQQGTDSAGANMAALAGTEAYTVSAADAALTHSCLVVDVYKPRERYLRAVITPDVQNAVITGITVIRYNGSQRPDLNTGVLQMTQLFSPAEA